jgi:SHS2 domain-containing protein
VYEVLERAAEALVAMAMETDDIALRTSYLLEAQGESLESLLVNWLSEVLYYLDGPRLALRSFHVKELTPNRVSAEAIGEPRDPSRQPAQLVGKGVTCHPLKIAQDPRGWFCEVFLDV